MIQVQGDADLTVTELKDMVEAGHHLGHHLTLDRTFPTLPYLTSTLNSL